MTYDDDLSTLLHDAVSDVEPAARLAELRVATAQKPSRFGWYAAGSVLAAAAAVTAFMVVTGPSTPRADDPGEVAGPTTHLDAVYYVGETPRGLRLYREFHESDRPDTLGSAMALLTDGPYDGDYTSFWSEGQLLDAYVADQVIHVVVDPAKVQPRDGIASTHLMIQQLIYTLQADVGQRFPVQFESDGNPVAEVMGVPTSEPLVNDPPLDVLSHVLISDPNMGDGVNGVLEARGAASSFEGNLTWTLRAEDGTVVREGFTTAGMDDHLVPWEIEPVDISDLPEGAYVFTIRTEGGKPFSDDRTVIVE